MLDPVTALVGLACGMLLTFRAAIGATALLCAAFLLTLGLIPIMMPGAVIALAAWAATGWLAARGLKRVRRSRASRATFDA